MFGLSGFEVAIILVFGFMIFGPDKLPQMARTIGRVIKQFRSAQEQMNKVIKAEVYDPIKDLEPLVNPFAGFSFDGSDDGAKKADTKKADVKKTVDKSKAALPEDIEGSKAPEESKLSSKDVQAALSEDAEKAKKKALKDTVSKSEGATSNTESFAERRARLEQEHTKAKSERDKAESTGAPEKTDAAKSTGAKTKPEASDKRKEDEKSH